MNRHRRWIQLCRALGATKNVDSSYRQIKDLYRTPIRVYHNIRHVEHCLSEYDAVSRLAVNPAAVEAAIWFHDAIYNSKVSDNEDKSASVAVSMLAAMGVGSKFCQDVRKLILHTKHAGVPRTGDGKIIVDVDLAILGSVPAGFDKYENSIRKEYAWVDESVFWPKRAEFLRTLLSRKRIYVTDFFFKRYEARARMNMSQSIARVGAAETIR